MIRSLLLCFSVLAALNTVHADHHVAMDLTYRATGVQDQYELTVKFFRDCNGMAMPADVVVCFNSVSCNFQGSVTLNRVSGPTLVPFPSCVVPPPGASSCSGGPVYGVQQSVFRGLLTLPYACSDWKLEYVQCCRNYAITNVQNAGTESFYLLATLDNLNFPGNSSPAYATIPVTMWCTGTPFIYDHGVTETDGDSLSFEFTSPMAKSNLVPCDVNVLPYPVTFTGGLSATQPFYTVAGTTIDPANGVVRCIANQVQIGVMDILVKEWRNGQLAGTTRRDIQVYFGATCQASIPEFVTGVVNGVPNAVAVTCGDTSVLLNIDRDIYCHSAALDGTDFLALDVNQVPLTVTRAEPVNCGSVFTRTVRLYFAQPLQAGVSVVWTRNGTDGNTLIGSCSDAMLLNDSVNLVAAPCNPLNAGFAAGLAGLCLNGCTDFTDQSLGNPTSWSWTFQGADPPTSTLQNVPSVCYDSAGVFDVRLIISNGSTTDTLACVGCITVYPRPVRPLITVSNDTLFVDPSYSNFQWYLSGQPIAGATQSFYVMQVGGVYSVTSDDPNGCPAPISNIDIVLGVPNAPATMPVVVSLSSGWIAVREIPAAFQDGHLRVYNLLGRLVREERISGTTALFDLSAHPDHWLLIELIGKNDAVYRVRLVRTGW